MTGRPCPIPGCTRERKTRRWCETHYSRWQRFGDPLATVRILGDEVARFWSYVDKTPSGCWLWTGHLIRGYGSFSVRRRPAAAHRYGYELLVGPIPEGLTLDHLCHRPAECAGGPLCTHRRCVNPAHLEPVTDAVNQERARRPTCRHGHPYDEANTYVHAKTGKRRCRKCMARANQRSRQKALALCQATT